jgi:hypothetical protein
MKLRLRRYFDELLARTLAAGGDGYSSARPELLHGSEANESTKRRCGLTLPYRPASVRAGLGWNEKGVIVSGKDESDHWASPPGRTLTEVAVSAEVNQVLSLLNTHR